MTTKLNIHQKINFKSWLVVEDKADFLLKRIKYARKIQSEFFPLSLSREPFY